MAHDHNGNSQLLAEILYNDCSRSGPRDAVITTHTAGLIDQQSNRQINRFGRQTTVTEDPAIITMEGVLVETLTG